MEFYPRLYIGKTVNNPNKLIHKLKKQSKLLQFYVITLSKNPSDQLEIYQACFLSQKYYKKNPVYVIGIASDYEEAVCIVQQIVEECYQLNGNCNLKEYLFCEGTLQGRYKSEKKPIEG